MADDMPRRIQIEKMVPAEQAIRAAVLAVEAMPADVRLTQAVLLLGQAQNKVADYVDGQYLHVYANDCEWVIAESFDDAYALLHAQNGLTRSDYEDNDDEIELLGDGVELEIWADASGKVGEQGDAGVTLQKRTCSDWVRALGRGYLCTTEH